MIYALAILIVTATICFALSFAAGRGAAARIVALVGVTAALVNALALEGLQGAGVVGAPIVWPDYISWLGTSFYTSDTLAGGLGAWCILLGGLCMVRLGHGEQTARKLSAGMLLVAVLYSLVYTTDLRAFAAQILLTVLLSWAVLWEESGTAGLVIRQRAGQAAGALVLLAAVLLMGRTTGGVYGLGELSLSALTLWPLLLISLFVVFWLGLAPFTGWSGLAEVNMGGEHDTRGTLVQGLVLGVPVVTLVLRLQALITGQALAGSIPPEWTAFTSALVWLGAITTLTAAAGTVVWAGTARWSGILTAYAMGSAVWALGLDAPTGRYAAVAILLAYGLGRLTLDLSAGRYGWLSRLAAGISLVGAPLTPGLVGIWLLASGLVESRRASLAIVLAAAVILAACGAALHLGADIQPAATRTTGPERYLGPLALLLSAALAVGGALPGLWLPQVEDIASIAGGGARIDLGWAGPMSGTMLVPLSLLAGAALVLTALGWLLRSWAKSRATGNSVLLPTAIARLQELRQTAPAGQPLLSNPPPAVWWLSLVWLESGIYGAFALLNRLAMRFGMLLARLEGRYYFPLALILTLLIILAVTR